MAEENKTQQDIIQQDLIKELGLENLSRDKQEELIIKMTETVLKRIFLETVSKLNEKDQETYAQMIEQQSSPEEMEKFLQEKIAGYDEMVKKVVDDFKEEMKK